MPKVRTKSGKVKKYPYTKAGMKKAKAELLKSRLKLGKVSYQQNEDLVPYTVLDQSISPGTVLDQSTTIDLIVSILDLQDIFDTLQREKWFLLMNIFEK